VREAATMVMLFIGGMVVTPPIGDTGWPYSFISLGLVWGYLL